ncbi:hypothetical protein ABOM_003866 [Aspergillus bombycis]|uniref:AMP-binding enzyme n=1 Tax=Aspergillus bombycis TaxID=109264 RepID=A0A1F8A675_9EURO|nr:hypothetical protein ABOM_003866 [Aspergillus bombycis]OGM47270.1 hypothetical protein ABOM_003866 [Aspergillus bombycis]
MQSSKAIVSSRFHIPIPCTNLAEYIFDSEPKNDYWSPEDPLLLSADDPSFPGYTFDQMKTLTKALACGMQESEGKQVVLYGYWNYNFYIALLGCLGAGAVCYNSPPIHMGGSVSRLESLKPEYLFVGPESLEDIPDILSQMAHTPRYEHWSSRLDFNDEFSWPKLCDQRLKAAPALVLTTSGTTGNPKLAERSHYGLIGNAEQLLYRYNLKKREKEIWLCNFFQYGIGFLLYGILAPLKARYGTIFMRGFSVERYAKAVEQLRPTSLHSPKHILQELLAHTNGADFSSVRSMRTGGAYIPYAMCDAWEKLHGSPCEVVCGMTEGGIHFASDPTVLETDETIGELLPNLEAKVVDNQGRVLAKNETGEIYIKNPFFMRRYRNNPEETKEVFSDDGWIKTGDLGKVNEKNRWYICGRKKDLFKVNGGHISAILIEQAISVHPEILEVVVVPVALPNEGEFLPRAYIVAERNSSLTPDLFLEWMEREIPSEMYTRAGVEFVDALPISVVSIPYQCQMIY